ncbi:hypothetical protein ACFWA5_47635 [Streptomyces mirabilis]|uniref:hypothetical protein n=1 Tax=Streptomyces mirabilis TaxID=68239 RepID=UPI003652707D
MGQTPAQKAAKAARGQQPKKKPGEAGIEAFKRAQSAKKKAGGGKPAAKKAVPLPRGSVRATCLACFKDYGKGTVITKVGESWGHPGCAPRQLSAADREFKRSKARIESGETFPGAGETRGHRAHAARARPRHPFPLCRTPSGLLEPRPQTGPRRPVRPRAPSRVLGKPR